MPIHDWTRVDAGIFHDFHISLISEFANILNNGRLPPDFYVLAKQTAGSLGAKAPARVPLDAVAEAAEYARRRRTLVVHHLEGHRGVALIEVLSPGTKASHPALHSFLDKTMSALRQGVHLLVIDLFPPGRHDPHGIHFNLWDRLTGELYEPPLDKPLTLAAYVAQPAPTAYVEPVAVGDALPDMPLFLTPDEYIYVPLESTYRVAYARVPRFYRDILDA